MLGDRLVPVMAVLLTLTALSGCMGTEGEGTVAVYVKDGPSDEFESVFVEFQRVEIHQAKSGEANATATQENETGETSATNGNSSWITVVDTPRTVDLKNFSGDARAFLGDADVPAGKYTQIRVFVDEAYGIQDGERVEFEVPSKRIKINHPWNVEEGGLTALVVDLDLDKSLHQKGMGEWQLKPSMSLLVEKPPKVARTDAPRSARTED